MDNFDKVFKNHDEIEEALSNFIDILNTKKVREIQEKIMGFCNRDFLQSEEESSMIVIFLTAAICRILAVSLLTMEEAAYNEIEKKSVKRIKEIILIYLSNVKLDSNDENFEK